jgi:hypothetical protein
MDFASRPYTSLSRLKTRIQLSCLRFSCLFVYFVGREIFTHAILPDNANLGKVLLAP